MSISVNILDTEALLSQLRKELAKPAAKIDPVVALRLCAQFGAAALQVPGALAAVEVPWGGVSPAVRSLLAGQKDHAGPLSVLGLDQARSEAACDRVEQLREALAIAQGLSEPLRATLQQEATALSGEAKGRYDMVRSLTVLPEVARTLQPATDHFYGPALRASRTRAVSRRAADRAAGEPKAPAGPGPGADDDDALLGAAPVATLAARGARRRSRRG